MSPDDKYKLQQKMYKVKFDTVTVRCKVIPILRRIEVGDYPAKIGRIVGLSRQHVYYYLKKLEKCRLIKRDKRTNVVFYQLTLEGTSFLTSCEGRLFPGELYRLDKCQVSFGVRVQGVVPEDFRRVEMVNWTALLGLEQGVKVRYTGKSWIVHVEVIRGKNPGEVYGLALNLANRVAVSLCMKYGFVLDEGKFVAGELAVDDPVAGLFGRYFTVSTPDRKIDHSWNVGELEHLQKDAVVEYLQMPERVKSIEGKFDRVMEALERVLERFMSSEGFGKDVDDSNQKLDRYVT